MFAALDIAHQDWRNKAACKGMDPEFWFPDRGASTREAKEVCADCPVRDECLDAALQNRELFGIWGGKSERERRKIRSANAKARRVAECGTEGAYKKHLRLNETPCEACKEANRVASASHRLRYAS